MPITYTIRSTVTVPGLATLPADPPVLITGTSAVEFEQTINSGATVEIDTGTIVASKIVAVVLNSSVTNMTLNTNAVDASGGQSFALLVGKSVEWDTSQLPLIANPVSVNVTKLFMINGGAKATVFRAGFLLAL